MMEYPAFKIAIVGVGPKGLYAFERILAELKANSIHEKIEIYLFNKTIFWGSGDVYRSDQPEYLLMNFANKHINMWTEDSPSAVVKNPLNLSEFIARKTLKNTDDIHPLFASRAFVGEYLENGFDQLCQNLPKNVILHQFISEVNSIEENGGSYSISFKQEGELFKLDNFQNMLISTGHQRHKENSSPNKVSFIYPVGEQLKRITEKDSVAIKGMGLTFIDAALALTEGKGGVFTETKDGKLSYKASGKEPRCIFPFSKSGWLMWPKYNFDDDQNLYVESLMSNQHKKLNFKTDILPLLAQDMEFAYYRTLFSHENELLKFESDFTKIRPQIDTFHQKYSDYEAFSLKSLVESEFDSEKSGHLTITDMLSEFTDEEHLKIGNKAKLAAAAIWRKISPIFNDIYSFKGLDAVSHQEFDNYYFGRLNRIAYGPPPVNLKKILALANAGIIDFNYAKNPELTALEHNYKLNSFNSEICCSVLINARIPKNTMEKETSGVFRNLCKNHLARLYVNKDETGCYELGTIEINKKGNLINPKGNLEHITLYGTPTEGVVHDNDTLSRTRNNFAKPWAREVIQHLITNKNEISQQQTAKTFATTK